MKLFVLHIYLFKDPERTSVLRVYSEYKYSERTSVFRDKHFYT